MKNLLIVFSGPSGVGKGTVIQEFLKKGNYALSVSCTTREKRDGEIEGVSYFFTDKEKFMNMLDRGGFLEYSRHFENYYGTPRKFVEEKLKTHDVILEIEVDGALQVKKAHPEALLIMILPPDEKALRERLVKRGTESAEKIEERLSRTAYELSKKHLYDYRVVNDNITETVKQIEKIIEKEKSK